LAATTAEAFGLFRRYVEEGLYDFQGDTVEVDFDDYTHVVHDQERIKRISWIEPTLRRPDEVWQWRSQKARKKGS